LTALSQDCFTGNFLSIKTLEAVMKRTTKSLALLFAVILVLITLPSSAIAHTDTPISKTFTLESGHDWIFWFDELQKNDYIKGNFTVSNLLPYKPIDPYPWTNKNVHTYSIDFKLTKQSDRTEPPYDPIKILSIESLKGDTVYNFNWQVNATARYYLIFECSEEYFPQDAKSPQVTLFYTVNENKPLEVNILSPANQTYQESSIPLNITTSRTDTSFKFYLDNTQIPFQGNNTLNDLISGVHTLTVNASDNFGYVDSQTVTFNVESYNLQLVDSNSDNHSSYNCNSYLSVSF
jgi:hypothetical protein